jgi:hypothetical protein
MPGGIYGTWPALQVYLLFISYIFNDSFSWMIELDWSNTGEIDIIEGVNSQIFNKLTLYINASCLLSNLIISYLGIL